ncbi:TetR/AcrR family transcriptional regulator [Mesobacterium sp. TK19101]|uniref:TetR/AcrR family transcriptional regulator n=1 Tax=Mesobacterium hydrothermale TaxID=3111907 RepID=A0ABU6HLF9_9RHOB|nr:TetR/AcrR family transcriptional regulator [Mesobacterium sp. TK19101]MEC3863293.1 TetR/AcrR family transcriptional regulator [Mesobacterium sp. TK19101]
MTDAKSLNPRTARSRARILDATEMVFREMGYEAAKVEAIAARAGLTRKTVYNHFSSKEALADAVIARAGAQTEPLYGPAIRSGEPALDLLATILCDSSKWCTANPDLARRALAPRLRPTASPPEDPSLQGVVIDAIRLGQSQGVIRQDEDAGFLSLVLLGLYAQAMLSALETSEIGSDGVRRIVRLVVEGIGT